MAVTGTANLIKILSLDYGDVVLAGGVAGAVSAGGVAGAALVAGGVAGAVSAGGALFVAGAVASGAGAAGAICVCVLWSVTTGVVDVGAK